MADFEDDFDRDSVAEVRRHPAERRKRWVAIFLALMMLVTVASQFVGSEPPPEPPDPTVASLSEQICSLIAEGTTPPELASALFQNDPESRTEAEYLDDILVLARQSCPELVDT